MIDAYEYMQNASRIPYKLRYLQEDTPPAHSRHRQRDTWSPTGTEAVHVSLEAIWEALGYAKDREE